MGGEQFDTSDRFEFLVLLPKPQALVLVESDATCLAVNAPLELPFSCMQVDSLKMLAL
jgi:hypothetical protein